MERCSTLRNSILSYFGDRVRVRERENSCVVSLPVETADNRMVSVIVESMGSTFIVHDGGKSLSELFCHGLPMTDARLDSQDALARSFGVELYRNKTLRKICSQSDLERTIFDVAQCSAATSLDIVSHKAKFESEDLSSRIYQTLTVWRPSSVRDIGTNVFRTGGG
jgi:hypothetical protein